MMATAMVSAPIIVPLRWLGRGVDVRVHITPDRDILVYGFDVFRALNIHRDLVDRHSAYPMAAAGILPTGVRFDGNVVDESHSAAPLYTLERIQQITTHSSADPDLVRDLNDWLTTTAADLLAPEVATHAGHPEPGLREFAQGGTYSIRRAAALLSKDPALSYGQQSLFDAMAALGWISRELGIWVPAEQPLNDGWLLRHKVRIGYERRGERVLYPQIRITTEGLHELHRRLGGIATLTLTEQPELTLLDGTA